MTKKKNNLGTYIGFGSDWSFKYYFGKEENKEILILFLNGLFQGEKVIKDLHYRPTIIEGENDKQRNTIFDLYCTGENGEHFIIEMQQVSQDFFMDRSVFYTSRLISQLVKKGPHGNNYELPEVYFIGLLEFCLPNFPTGQYFIDVGLCEKISKELFYPKLGFKFLVLPNFNKQEAQIHTDMDKWFYLLKHMSELDRIPDFLDKRIFGRIFDIGKIANLNKEDMNEYEISLKRRLDARSIQATKERLETELQQSRLELQQNKQELQQNKQELQQNKQELQQNKQALEEKDKALEKKNQIIEEMQSRDQAIICNLKKQGFSIEQILAVTNFDLALVSKAYNQED